MRISKGDFFKARIDGRTILVEIAANNGDFVTAWRVTKTGEHFETVTKDTVSRHLMVFKQTDLRQRMQMNLHYGELEVID